MAGIQTTLPPEFGWVVLDIVFCFFVMMWMVYNLVAARIKYDVKYPTIYSDKHHQFNCVQRVHQNTLEQFPVWSIFLVLGGLQHPKVSAVAGFVWVVSRMAYALGYYTGGPRQREWGAFGMFGYMANIGCTFSFALHLLGFI